MYCSQCGTQVAVSAQFCPHCIADLTASGAIRLTVPMTAAEVAAEMPDELLDTAIRPAVVVDEAPAPTSAPASPRTPLEPAPSPTSSRNLPPSQNLEDAQRRVRAAASRQHTRRNRMAVVVLGLALLAAVVPIVIVSWQFFNLSPDSAIASPSASQTPASQAPSSQPPSSAVSSPTASRPSTPTRLPWPAYALSCGADVAVNKQTSCAFAVVVLGKVDRTRTDPFEVTAVSPVTQQTYTLSCTRPDFIVCTGGRSVRILLQPL